MMHMPMTPATLIIRRRNVDEVWIGERIKIEHEPTGNPPATLVLEAMGEQRIWPLESDPVDAGGEWTGQLLDSEVTFHTRGTLPRDAESSVTMEGFPRIPMPVDLLAYIHSTGDHTMPDLFALTDDDGFVATMMLSAPTGLYVRYASMWHAVTDPDVVDGLTVHEVAPAALELFDARERAGQLPNVSAMQALEGGDLGIVPTNDPVDTVESAPFAEDDEQVAPTETVMTASGATIAVPQLRTPEDVPAALSAAAENPDIQWWVERRLKVLGIEADLPWS